MFSRWKDASVLFRVHVSNEFETRVSQRIDLIPSQKILDGQNAIFPKLKMVSKNFNLGYLDLT